VVPDQLEHERVSLDRPLRGVLKAATVIQAGVQVDQIAERRDVAVYLGAPARVGVCVLMPTASHPPVTGSGHARDTNRPKPLYRAVSNPL
jgi:hypothetical protein